MGSPYTIRPTDVGGDGSDTAQADDFYARFKEDVDGLGTDLTDFVRSAFRKALVKGRAWWLASLPTPEFEPVNAFQAEAAEMLDVRLSAMDAEDVIDWCFDKDGDLEWAMCFEQDKARGSLLENRGALRKTWRYYDETNITTFERVFSVDEQKSGVHTDPDSDIQQISKEPHGFTRVPLIHVFLPDGLWLLDRVYDAQIEHFRLSAGLGWMIRRTCYATPVFQMDGDEGDAPIMGAGRYVRIGANDKMGWTAPPSDPFEVISSEIKSEKDEIYRVAQQMAQGVDNNAAAVGRSGESKIQDASATEVCLKAYGAEMRGGIERTLDLVSDGRGDKLEWSAQGLDKFNLHDANLAVTNATAAKALAIPSETFTQELYVHTAEALLPALDQGKKDQIRKEIEDGVAEEMEAKKQLQQAQQEALLSGDMPPPGMMAAGPQAKPQLATQGKKPDQKQKKNADNIPVNAKRN